MKKKGFFQLIILCFFSSLSAQTIYTAGVSNISIQPPDSIFSLSLAGYGLPLERFTITWNEISSSKKLKSIAASNGKLYATTKEGELLSGNPAGNAISWTKTNETANIDELWSANDNLYINKSNKLMAATMNGDKVKWKVAGKGFHIDAFTSWNGKFYGINGTNLLVTGNPLKKRNWKIIDRADSAVCLAADDRLLYKINPDHSIWCTKGNIISWTKIGRVNAETFTIDLKRIVVLNNRLYGVDNEGKLYIANHSASENTLSARSLAIKQGNHTIVLVGVDLCGFNETLINEVKEEIFKKTGVPSQAILINASHTHFAPVTQNFYPLGDFYRYPDSTYLNNFVKAGIIRSIESALRNMVPVNIYFARGATNIGKNRRSHANPKAPYDNTLDIIKVVSADNRVVGILFSTACHAVFKNDGKDSYTISSNFPDVARKAIEKQFGGTAIFIQGCAGDINPRSQDYRQTGSTLAQDIINTLNGEETALDGNLSCIIDTVNVPVKAWSIQEIQKVKEDGLKQKGVLEADRDVRWANQLLERYTHSQPPVTMPVYVQTLHIGNWKLIALSREAVTEYASTIKGLWPNQLVTVVGYSNDVSSYLPNAWHVDKEVYEGKGSFFWYGEPAPFPRDVMRIVVDNIQKKQR